MKMHCLTILGPKIKLLVDLVSSELSLLGWWMVIFALCLDVVVLLWVNVFLSPRLIRMLIGPGPTLMTSFCLIYLFKDPISRYSYMRKHKNLEDTVPPTPCIWHDAWNACGRRAADPG